MTSQHTAVPLWRCWCKQTSRTVTRMKESHTVMHSILYWTVTIVDLVTGFLYLLYFLPFFRVSSLYLKNTHTKFAVKRCAVPRGQQPHLPPFYHIS